jgi:rSAM/selenodomain-associated transferase 2
MDAGHSPHPASKISIIIPTLNEADMLEALLHTLQQEAPDAEIIVADGGSADDTIAIAQRHGVHVLRTARGRGRQLAEGGQAARGDVLLFVHADCRFPPNGLKQIEQILSEDGDIIGGNFRLLFDGGDAFSTWLNGFYRWIRQHGFYYGDSAVFVRHDAYRALGGIRPIALMEDYDFNRRMERFGKTCCIDDPPMVTSSRRFAGRHPAAIVWGWIKIHLLFFLGVSPDTLARIYDSERRKNPARV